MELKIPMCDKHKQIAHNCEYQTRPEGMKSQTSFNKELENALTDAINRKSDRIGCCSLVIAQLKVNSDNSYYYGSTTKKEYVNLDQTIYDNFSNLIEPLSYEVINEVHLDGYFQLGDEPYQIVSNLIFGAFMRYLLETRFKVQSSKYLLELRKRGKYLKAGIIEVCLTTIIFRSDDGAVINLHDLYLLIDFNDGTYCVTDEASRVLGINQDVEVERENEEQNIEEEQVFLTL